MYKEKYLTYILVTLLFVTMLEVGSYEKNF